MWTVIVANATSLSKWDTCFRPSTFRHISQRSSSPYLTSPVQIVVCIVYVTIIVRARFTFDSTYRKTNMLIFRRTLESIWGMLLLAAVIIAVWPSRTQSKIVSIRTIFACEDMKHIILVSTQNTRWTLNAQLNVDSPELRWIKDYADIEERFKSTNRANPHTLLDIELGRERAVMDVVHPTPEAGLMGWGMELIVQSSRGPMDAMEQKLKFTNAWSNHISLSELAIFVTAAGPPDPTGESRG